LSLFEVFLKSQNLGFGTMDDQYGDTTNTLAAHLQRHGRFADAERLHRHALEIHQRAEFKMDGLEEIVRYNIMIAIARQPSRLEEAFQYRRQHLPLIAKAEAKFGDLESRIQALRVERELYDDAKAQVARGSLKQDSEWYLQHRAELWSAQLRWGWLDDFPESDKVD
jgi:hypothetical protein